MYTRLLLRQDSKWRPSPSGRHQLHTPRGAQQNLLRGPLWPQLFGPSGHEQARKREATAPGQGAIGAANAAPSSRREPANKERIGLCVKPILVVTGPVTQWQYTHHLQALSCQAIYMGVWYNI
ncbi:hypothetical protein NDU88_003779 [Pleurodeles waltl]|uniref:Uncharacterized protein n=1 Tax=Pleurodeles waltl TaxID=8319 RepID=A0AAV7SGY3_PLEWA|nr:hypothetical protein NDU88_003779 [Pleurodeles waltl]